MIHEYVALDMARVVDAVRHLGPVRQFMQIAASIEQEFDPPAS